MIAVAIVVPVLAVSLGAAWGRQHGVLPAKADAVRLAVLDAAELASCFQGVQDDVLAPPGGGRDPDTVRAARERLDTCDTRPLERHLAESDLPRAAPVTGDRDRRSLGALAAARSSLRRVLIEAEGTKRAMSRDLETGRAGAALVAGYRSMEADYERAVEQLARSPIQPG